MHAPHDVERGVCGLQVRVRCRDPCHLLGGRSDDESSLVLAFFCSTPFTRLVEVGVQLNASVTPLEGTSYMESLPCLAIRALMHSHVLE